MAERDQVDVYGGVDTHSDTHVAAVLDHTGRLLGSEEFRADAAGYAQLERWLRAWGRPVQVGVEGCGSYGAGLARYLARADIEVVEVMRPNRQMRRLRAKCDTVDAEAAARAALNGEATAQPKAGDGPVEGIRMLRMARRSAVKARTQAANQIHALVVTAPEQVKHRLQGSSIQAMVRICVRWRPGEAQTTTAYANKGAAAPGPPIPDPRHRNSRTRYRDPQSLRQGQPGAPSRIRSGPPQRCSTPRRRRRQPPTHEIGTVLRGTMRPQPRPRIIRTDSSASAQPRRRPPSQQRSLANRHQPDTHRPPHHRIHPQTKSRRQNPPRDHPLPQTAHRTRDLPPTNQTIPNTPRQRPTPPNPTNPHRRRRTPPSPPHPPITPRTRPPPQPPARHPIPEMAHRPPPQTDLQNIGASGAVQYERIHHHNNPTGAPLIQVS